MLDDNEFERTLEGFSPDAQGLMRAERQRHNEAGALSAAAARRQAITAEKFKQVLHVIGRRFAELRAECRAEIAKSNDDCSATLKVVRQSARKAGALETRVIEIERRLAELEAAGKVTPIHALGRRK
ncbi:hypothetical protein GOD68_17930 [Sinorhizobium medicae]|nr:hypothetical protein [Sinorhizobium medicae]MDX0671891.1 hypothetical protein [Sinorhizobium medicae]MDX0709171.1 hypothetical protein [Sinorhizobium medicae]